MTSKLALRLPPPTATVVATVAPRTPSPPVSARRSSALIHQRIENNELDLVCDSTEMKKNAPHMSCSPVSSKHDTNKKTQLQAPTVAFPAVEYLLQTVEDSIYDGAFQGGSEHRLLDLVKAAKRELKAQTQRIALLEQQNEALEGECRRFQSSVTKIQSQSENLRRSSHNKEYVCVMCITLGRLSS